MFLFPIKASELLVTFCQAAVWVVVDGCIATSSTHDRAGDLIGHANLRDAAGRNTLAP